MGNEEDPRVLRVRISELEDTISDLRKIIESLEKRR